MFLTLRQANQEKNLLRIPIQYFEPFDTWMQFVRVGGKKVETIQILAGPDFKVKFRRTTYDFVEIFSK